MIRPEQDLPHHTHDTHHPLTALGQTEKNLEQIIKHDPHHEHMGEVYKELDGLREKDRGHFGKDLKDINEKLHKDGLLPHLSIIQDRYTGADGKEHGGFSMIADDPHHPGHRVGTEVSSNHPQAHGTETSHHAYGSMHHHGHGHHSHFGSGRDTAEGGKAAHGGYDGHLNGQVVPTGERKEMIDKALQIAGVSVNAKTEAAMNTIITRESHWNPNIVNTWDSNAQKGDPSKGLMQVIHSTFEANRDHKLPDNQTDPLANMVAAVNYMGKRYGHGDKEAGLLHVASRPGGY